MTSPGAGAEAHRLAGRLANLRRRGRALQLVRDFFARRDFLEIEAPLLVPSPGVELHLDAFAVPDAFAGATRYLITSPEYQLKRLLAAGLDRIYSLGKCFRRGELGPHHNPEFTMVEWYRAPGGWEEIATDVEALVVEVLVGLTDGEVPRYRGQPLELGRPFRRLSVREAMARFAGVTVEGDEPAAVLAERGRAAGHRLPPTLTAWDDVFFTLFLDAVEPHLGEAPTVLFDWPAPLASLARLSPSDPRVAERFEVYVAGVELANGFGELLDPLAQRRRCEAERGERGRRGLPVYPLDERFLDALADVAAPAAGVALGLDRLILLACDAPSLREVLPFAADEL